jgi:hypothetical protein
VLNHEKIREIYGNPPTYNYLKWPKTNMDLTADKGAHWVMIGHEDCFKVPVVCQLTHMMRNGLVHRTMKQIALDLYSVCHK